MERQQIYLSFLNQILKLLKILKCIILICTLYDANGKDISSEQIKDVFPVQITLNASLPYTWGKIIPSVFVMEMLPKSRTLYIQINPR